MQHFNIILALTACYFAVVLGFVLYARLKSTKSLLPGLNEFFLAGKNLPSLVLTLTYIGSLFSTFTVLGLSGLVYSNGIGGVLFVLVVDAIAVALFFYIAKKLRRLAEGKRIFSPLEVISHQYKSRKLGFFMACIFVIFLMPYISLQLVGVGAFINSYTDGYITYTSGVGSMMLVVLLYLFLGGMRAIAYTDFIQILASFLGLTAGLWLLFSHFDLNFLSVIEKVNSISPEHLSLPGPNNYYEWPFFITVSLVSVGIFIQPHLMTRALMAKNDSQINFMMIGTIIGMIIAAALVFFIGMAAFVTFGPDLKANFLMGHVYKELGNLGILGLIISALMLMGALGAAMSTADSLLISIGQVSTRDMVRPFFKITPKKQVILSKLIMGFVLISAFLTGLNPPKFMTDLAIYSAAGSALMIPTIISFYWKKRSSFAAFVSIACGLLALIAAVGYKFQTGNNIAGMHVGTFPLLISFVLYYGICLCKKADMSLQK